LSVPTTCKNSANQKALRVPQFLKKALFQMQALRPKMPRLNFWFSGLAARMVA
jgi:hypothetical protein